MLGKNLSLPYPVTIFEHGIVGQTIKHAHLHLLPGAADLTSKIRADFPSSEIEEIRGISYLPEIYSQISKPYLFWTTPSGKSLVCWNPPAPPQYLRIIFSEAVARPERANWRNMDPELDKKLWTETVRHLKPYFS